MLTPIPGDADANDEDDDENGQEMRRGRFAEALSGKESQHFTLFDHSFFDHCQPIFIKLKRCNFH